MINEVGLAPELSTIAPEIVLVAVLVPVSVSVLAPAPVAVKLLVNTIGPVPSAEFVAPPVDYQI